MTYEDEGFNRREKAYDEMPEADCTNCFNAWPASDLDAETQRCPNCRMRDPDWQEEPCDRKALSAKLRREVAPTLKSVRKEREPALADLRTVSLVSAGQALGVGRQTAYRLAQRNEFPLPVLKVGKKLRVSTAALARLLGAEEA